jgi:hypothetical protein
MKRVVVLVAAVVAGLSGCASPARYVEQAGAGGVVAVPTYEQRAEALTLIKKHVGPDYVIVQEGEVPTAAVTTTTEKRSNGSVVTRAFSWFTGDKGNTTTVTAASAATEWRIEYAARPPMPVPVAGTGAQGPTGGLFPAGGTTVQTQYVSPNGPQSSVTPAGYGQKLSQFDAGCKG